MANDRHLRVLASAGLAVGGVLGMAGTFARLQPFAASVGALMELPSSWRAQDMMVARKGDWKYVRWDAREYLANLAEDETENANFKLKNPAMFERLKRAYQDWDKEMLPIPPEVRRGPWENLKTRARDLESV